MAWTVTRQLQWPEGDHVVEISYGGLEYINPDMLMEKYAGEGETYDDPRDAVEAAIEIAQEWQQDTPNKSILIGYGSTGGMTLPLEGEELSEDTFTELRRWAAEAYEKLSKCSQCGEILPAKNNRWKNWELLWGEEFCSEYCIEQAVEAVLNEDEEEKA